MSNRKVRSRSASSLGGFAKNLQAFILRGNVVDLAVAVIMGAAFTGVVNSLVEDIVTPIILRPALESVGVKEISALSFNGIKYGLFLAAVINLLVVGLVLFLVVNFFEKIKRKEELDVPAEPTIEEKLNETLSRLADKL